MFIYRERETERERYPVAPDRIRGLGDGGIYLCMYTSVGTLAEAEHEAKEGQRRVGLGPRFDKWLRGGFEQSGNRKQTKKVHRCRGRCGECR